MSEERIDSNHKNTWGFYNESTNIIENARVDPVLGYLEVFLVPYVTGTFTAIDHAKIDGNGRNTISAFNETTGLIESLRCGPNGELLIVSV